MNVQQEAPSVLPTKLSVLGISIVMGCGFIGLMSLVLGVGGEASKPGVLLLDARSDWYPITIQNVMHLFFFIGMGEIYQRWKTAHYEAAFLKKNYLPDDDVTVLQASDLGPIRSQVTGMYDGENGFLPSLIDLCILQFQASRSVEQAVAVMNSSLELIAHRVDLRYLILRYIVWVIPTIGFIGTVVGIASGLSEAAKNIDAPDLKAVTTKLAIAFDTTLIALILSAILVLLLHLVQRKEENCVNQAGHYCLKNLINRLYTSN